MGKYFVLNVCRERALGVKRLRGIYYGRDKKKKRKKERKKKKREEKYHRENGVAPRYRGLNTKRGTGGIAGVSYSLANLGPHCSVLIEGEYHGR